RPRRRVGAGEYPPVQRRLLRSGDERVTPWIVDEPRAIDPGMDRAHERGAQGGTAGAAIGHLHMPLQSNRSRNSRTTALNASAWSMFEACPALLMPAFTAPGILAAM